MPNAQATFDDGDTDEPRGRGHLRSSDKARACQADLEQIAREAHAFRLAQVFESLCESLAAVLPLQRVVLSGGSGTSRFVMHEWPSASTSAPNASSPDASPDVVIGMRRARGLECTLDLFLQDCDDEWDTEFVTRISVPVSSALSFAHGETSTLPPAPSLGRNVRGQG